MTPSIDKTLHQFLILLLRSTLLPNLTFFLIVRGFYRTFATGVTCQQRTLTPPDTWSCPYFGLACVLMLRPISPELVLFPDFWVSNIPRFLCFASGFFFSFTSVNHKHFLFRYITTCPCSSVEDQSTKTRLAELCVANIEHEVDQSTRLATLATDWLADFRPPLQRPHTFKRN